MKMSDDVIRRLILSTIGIAMSLSFATTSSGQQLATADTKTVENPSGVITGLIVSRAGEPLVGAVGFVSRVGGGRTQSATVDSAGTFKVEGLDAGLYRVWANVPGYVPELLSAANDSPRYYHVGDSVTLTMIKGGVITGKVTTATNEPAVAATVRVLRVRNESGKPLQAIVAFRERLTDDRGAYRIYGLLPGAYIVSVGGPPLFAGAIAPGAYDNDAPTYAPSSTRDAASEIYVGIGEEITADIQYRGEPGHAVSGTLSGLAQSQNQISTSGTVRLVDLRNRAEVAIASATSSNSYAFSFSGVADGEYELFGSQFLTSRDSLTSEGRRIKVQGADVTGINLTVAPLGSIEGRLTLEGDTKANCGRRRETATRETIVFGRRHEPETETTTTQTSKAAQHFDVPITFTNAVLEGIPDASGAFALKNLQRGSYWIEPRAPASGWYVRSVGIGPAISARTAKTSNSNVPRDGITLKSSERVSGLTVTIAEGAASFRGRLTVAEGQSPPPNLRVHLVPAEKESGDTVLRFFEARAESDGSFAIGNIAPGHYLIVGHAADDGPQATVKPIRQDSALRSQVLKEAEKTRNEIQLQPCQRIVDYEMRYPPAASETKPKP